MSMENLQAFDLTLRRMVDALRSRASENPAPLSGPLLIYGAGNKGQQVAAVLLQLGYSVLGFADANPAGRESSSMPVRTLSEWKPHVNASRTTVIVAVHNYRTPVASILNELQEQGFARLVTPVELHGLFPDALGTHYWLTGTQDYAARFDQLPVLATHLADAASQSLLEAVVRFRLTGDYACLPSPTPDEQYRPNDIPSWPESARLIDCGAFDGDTLRNFLDSGVRLDAVVAFEPDPKNFDALATYVRNTPSMPPVLCVPAGVGEQTEICSFESEGGAASKISTQGNRPIQIVALDDAIGSFVPTLIKMDVEGAELQAIKGARRLLKEYRPALAISLYHRPEDLWNIPDFLLSMELGYTFYLRCHGENTFDLVLYAVPTNVP